MKVWLPTKPKALAKASMPDDFAEWLEELEQEDREVEFSSDNQEQDL